MDNAGKNRVRVGATIRRLRTQQRISLRTFAKMTNIDYSNLSCIENGKVNVSLDLLSKIADGLDVDLKELFQ